MKATFNITKLWQSKAKSTSQKTKAVDVTRSKRSTKQDSWDMSPEDALRVAYTGYK